MPGPSGSERPQSPFCSQGLESMVPWHGAMLQSADMRRRLHGTIESQTGRVPRPYEILRRSALLALAVALPQLRRKK